MIHVEHIGYPEINKRVLIYFHNDETPAVAYWDGKKWCLDIDNFPCDIDDNTVEHNVIGWIDLPKIDFQQHLNNGNYLNFTKMTKYEF